MVAVTNLTEAGFKNGRVNLFISRAKTVNTLHSRNVNSHRRSYKACKQQLRGHAVASSFANCYITLGACKEIETANITPM